MKKMTFFHLLLLFNILTLGAQDLSKKEVPSVILNNFQNSFPKASDIEWEKKGDHYKVDFEIGFRNNDHTAWYNSEGELLHHKEEISRRDLPEAVYSVIKENYKWYIIKDIERITKNREITYKVELKSIREEWDIVFDEAGEIINKRRD